MRLIPSKIKGADEAKTAWTDIIGKLESVNTSIDPDSFLLHYWLSKQSYVSKASLFIHFKGEIKKTNAKQWLEDLRRASSTYIKCLAPADIDWAKEERTLKDSMQALRIFGVAQAAPLILSIMRKYESKIISLKTAKQAIEVIEKFTFQFNAVTQSRGGGGVSNMYAKLAQSASACATSQAFAILLAEIREKPRERVPDETEFSLAFTRLTYRSTYTRDRALVRYALIKLSEQYGMPEEVDRSMLTIEHLMPQSVGEETGDEFDVGAIGNLILVNETVNGKLGVKPFSDKMEVLRKTQSLYVDDELKEAKSWSDQNIADRGVRLARLGHSKVWQI